MMVEEIDPKKVDSRINELLMRANKDEVYDEVKVQRITLKDLQFNKETDKIKEDGFGSHYQAMYRGQIVAVKILNKQKLSSDELDQFKKEIGNMSKSVHPYIVKLIGACTEPDNLLIVTEKCETDVCSLLREYNHNHNLSLAKRMKIAWNVAQAMVWLHESGIIHGNLKPENLLIDRNNQVRISDFVFSEVKKTDPIKNLSPRGSLIWMAPEKMLGLDYTEKIDVFSFGIILWELATRQRPYGEYTEVEPFCRAVCFEHVRPPLIPELPHDLKLLMAACWQNDPNLRPSFRDIERRLGLFYVDTAAPVKVASFWKKYFLDPGQQVYEEVAWSRFEQVLRHLFTSYEDKYSNTLKSLFGVDVMLGHERVSLKQLAKVSRLFSFTAPNEWALLEHEQYVKEMLKDYVPRPNYSTLLDQAVTGHNDSNHGLYVIMTGEAGSGKSSLLADWWNKFKINSSFIFFIGLSAFSNSLEYVILQLYHQLDSNKGKIEKPKDDGDILSNFTKLLKAASLQGGIVIILDGIENLPSQYHNLHWLPLTLPPKVFVILSSSPVSQIMEVVRMKSREQALKAPFTSAGKHKVDSHSVVNKENGVGNGRWLHIPVEPLDAHERKKIQELLIASAGPLDEKIILHPCARLPLFIKTVAVSQKYTVKSDLLNCSTIDEVVGVFQRELEVVHRKILCLLAKSRSGLTAGMLLSAMKDLYGPLYVEEIRTMLVLYRQQFNCRNKDTVLRGFTPQEQYYNSCTIVEALSKAKFDEMIAHKLPWQIESILEDPLCHDSPGYQQQLADILLDLRKFPTFYENDSLRVDLIRYWHKLTQLDSKWKMGQMYLERAKVILKSGFEDPQLAHVPSFSTVQPSLSEDSTINPTNPTPTLPVSSDDSNIIPPPTPTILVLSSANTESVVSKDIKVVKEPKESIPTRLLHSMATNMSTSSTPTRPRAASVASTSQRPISSPPPLLCRHASIESISKSPPSHANFQSPTKRLSKIFFSLSSFLHSRDCYQEAIEVGELALAEYRTNEDKLGTASVLHLLGMITNDKGDIAKSCPFFEEELQIRVEEQGTQHQDVLMLMDQLGWLMRRTGEFFGSLKYFTRALTLQKEQGNRDQLTLSTLNGLGSVQTELGNLVQAREYFNEALSLATSFGEKDATVAQTLHNIGVLHIREEKWNNAMSCCERAYSIRVELEGNKHILVAESMSLFGVILMQLGKLADAEKSLKKALDIQVSTLGNEQQEVASTFSNLGVLEKRRGNFVISKDYHEKALVIRSKLFGEQHPLTESSFHNLGAVCFSSGDFLKARECFEKILSSQIVRFGSYSHPRLQQTLGILEAIVKRQGLIADAKYFSSKLNSQQNKQLANDLLEESSEWKAMKMIVLGNGQIGKTTFVRFLHQYLDPTVKKEDFSSTIGIECRTMHIGTGRVGVFDFAGQMEYCVTHQHFLSSNLSLYIVCFDLSASINEQRRQISTWLQYLNSLLTIQSSTTTNTPSCSIILVGTKADKVGEKQAVNNTHVYQQSFPSLHLIDKVHHISTLFDQKSVRDLIVDVESRCSQIMNEHANLIPRSYQQLLKDISSIESASTILPASTVQSLPNTQWKEKPDLMNRGLTHLHAIGEIVLFGQDKICRRPQEISRLMAKFISPYDVRNALLCDEGDQINILPTSSISEILQVNIKSNKIIDELELMKYFGVCFEVPAKLQQCQDQASKLFVFPSLGERVDLKFTIERAPNFSFFSKQVKAKKRTTFVPGFFTQLLVTICQELNIFYDEIHCMASNGMVITCAGMMDGQLIVFTDPHGDSSTLMFVVMASNPESSAERVYSIFQSLVHDKFPNCIFAASGH